MKGNFQQYDNADLWQKDRDHNIHPWTDFATFKEEGSEVMAEAEGVYVYNAEGERYMDGIGGLWCVNIGYGREEMAQAIADQVRRIPYYSTFTHLTTPPAAELAAKLAELAPASINHVFYGTGGFDGERHRRPRDPLLFQPPGQAEQEEDHLACRCLSRLDLPRDDHDRREVQPRRLRPRPPTSCITSRRRTRIDGPRA